MQTTSDPSTTLERLQRAINQHDLEALIACFAPDYQSEFPAHPDRTFSGVDQIRVNWSRMFSSVPDIQIALIRSASTTDTVWAEWEWNGTQVDGAPFAQRGVTIQGIKQGQIIWARLYMEPVQSVGSGADDIVQRAST